jgi:drug/metabolite transporter (DMT)-like permease
LTASKSWQSAQNGWSDSVSTDAPAGRLPSRFVIMVSVALVVTFWSINFIAAKIAVRYISSIAAASFRVILGGSAMLPAYFLCSRFPTFVAAAEMRKRGFSAGNLWTFVYLGFFGVVINQMCFTVSLGRTSVTHAAVIVGMAPIYTLALAVLFRVEKGTLRKATGMGIAFAGVAILAAENGISLHSPSLLGDAIAMAGSIGFAVYVVLGKRVSEEYDALTMIAFNHFTGALIILPVAIHEIRTLHLVARWREIPWECWAAVLYMAICSSVVGYVLYFWLLRYLEASQLSAFTYLLPVVATILGIVFLGERGSLPQVLGGVLALAGVYWVESGREA